MKNLYGDHSKTNDRQLELCNPTILIHSFTVSVVDQLAHHGVFIRFPSVTHHNYSLPITSLRRL